MQEIEGISTVFGKSNERSVNSKGKLHRQLRRHNACDNKNAIEKKLGFLEVSLNTCQVLHLDRNKELRVRICWPLTQTYQLAAIAKMRRNPMKRNDSTLFAEIRSVEKIMVLTSWPWAVPNPVRTTTPRQPLSGVLIGEGISAKQTVNKKNIRK
jgi:hypothetical protein